MLSNAYTGQATFRCQRLLRTLLVLPRPLFRLRAEALPRFLQLRHKGREVDALRSLERSPANTVIRSWRSRMAVRTQGHARVVGGFHRHPTIDSCVCGFVGCAIWLFAEQIHQHNIVVYPAAPGARPFVKLERTGNPKNKRIVGFLRRIGTADLLRWSAFDSIHGR